MTDRIEALRELAEAATPGGASGWQVGGGDTPAHNERRIVRGLGLAYIARCTLPEDAAYIAAASPDFMLKLLEVVDKARVAEDRSMGASLDSYWEAMSALRASLDALERA